ncbi:MAG: small basic family protein [Succiniclasticum sp.]|jgi:small basic protein
MIYALLGLVLGVVLGILAPGYIPQSYAPYFSVALMSGLDTVFGGLRASMEGRYENTVFLSGFFVNMLVAVFFCYAGTLLNIDFYLIVILVLGMRVFNNLAIIRRLYLDEKEKERAKKEEAAAEDANKL